MKQLEAHKESRMPWLPISLKTVLDTARMQATRPSMLLWLSNILMKIAQLYLPDSQHLHDHQVMYLTRCHNLRPRNQNRLRLIGMYSKGSIFPLAQVRLKHSGLSVYMPSSCQALHLVSLKIQRCSCCSKWPEQQLQLSCLQERLLEEDC